MLRRSLLTALPLAGALALSGVAVSAEDVTLRFWSGGFNKEGQRTVREMISAFEAENPGIKVDYTAIAWDKYRAQISTAATLGETPDMWVDGLLMVWQDAGITADNADLYARLPAERVAAFAQAPIDVMKQSVGLVSFPFMGLAWTIAYNKELFAERGIEAPAEPISLEQLMELSERMTFDRDGDGRNDVYGYGLIGARLSSHFFNMIFYKLGGEWADLEGTLIVDQYRDQFVEALVYMREIAEFTPGGATAAVGRTYEATRALFAQERVAMVADVGEISSVMADLAPEVAEKLSFLRIDFGLNSFDNILLGKTEHREEAFKFIEFYTDRDWMVRLNDAMGSITPRTDVADHPMIAGNANLEILAEQLADPSGSLHPGLGLSPYAALRPAVWDAVAEVLLGGDPGEAADKAIATMTNQFAQQ